jgi:hypothetical protein
MTNKTRNWLIALLSIPAVAILAVVGLLIFNAARPLPPIQPLPNPNGYNDLVKAGEMADNHTGDWNEMSLEELRRLVAQNANALQLTRDGLQRDCVVPLQFSESYMSRHLSELSGCKKLAQAFAAEGRLADMENRPSDAAKSYLDAISLGNKSARGGILIDQLVGIAIKAIGTSHLQKLVDQLDAKSCRETAATLETLDAQGQTLNEAIEQDVAWSRRSLTGLSHRIYRLFLAKRIRIVVQAAEQRHKKQQSKTRQLIIDLAARAYELDKGHRPAGLVDLVPDYLKSIPQDPSTGTNIIYSP